MMTALTDNMWVLIDRLHLYSIKMVNSTLEWADGTVPLNLIGNKCTAYEHH